VTGDRQPFDVVAYAARSRHGACFICAHLAGDEPHREVYADEVCVAFLNRYPTLRGYTLVAPRRHVVDVTGDRALFRHLTDVVHDVAEALPYQHQQFHALMAEHGVLAISDPEQDTLVRDLHRVIVAERINSSSCQSRPAS
jgi:hypothetical protein